MLGRRGFLVGLLAAPAIIRSPGLLMPVRPVALVVPLAMGFDLSLEMRRLWSHQMWQAFRDESAAILEVG